jgi:DNA-binding Lrp family transcriptional regulator
MATDKKATDIAILRALQKDARQSNEAIGEQVGKDGSVVSRRIAELVKARAITGIHAAIDPQKVGLVTTIYKLVRLTDHKLTVTSAFEREIDTWPNVIEWARLEGSWDYLLKFLVRDTVQHDRLHNALLQLPMIQQVRGMRAHGQPRSKAIPLDDLT